MVEGFSLYGDIINGDRILVKLTDLNRIRCFTQEGIESDELFEEKIYSLRAVKRKGSFSGRIKVLISKYKFCQVVDMIRVRVVGIKEVVKLIKVKSRPSKLIGGAASAIEKELRCSGLNDQSRSMPVFARDPRS